MPGHLLRSRAGTSTQRPPSPGQPPFPCFLQPLPVDPGAGSSHLPTSLLYSLIRDSPILAAMRESHNGCDAVVIVSTQLHQHFHRFKDKGDVQGHVPN